MKKALRLAGLVFSATLGAAAPSQAQWGIAPYVGYHLDAEQVHLGSAVQFTLPTKIGKSQLVAAPGFDMYAFMPDAPGGSSSMYVLNLDMLYPFETKSPILPYVGAGLAVARTSVSFLIAGTSFSASSTDMGLNLKGGAFFNKGKKVRPFAEAAFMVGNGSTLLLRGGVHFAVGK